MKRKRDGDTERRTRRERGRLSSKVAPVTILPCGPQRGIEERKKEEMACEGG